MKLYTLYRCINLTRFSHWLLSDQRAILVYIYIYISILDIYISILDIHISDFGYIYISNLLLLDCVTHDSELIGYFTLIVSSDREAVCFQFHRHPINVIHWASQASERDEILVINIWTWFTMFQYSTCEHGIEFVDNLTRPCRYDITSLTQYNRRCL